MYIPTKLYKQIVTSMPIACVDLLTLSEDNRILLLKRKNSPARGQWWFPGGRILHGETRRNAVIRKLKGETGLYAYSAEETGTYDVILGTGSGNKKFHAITTVFKVMAENDGTLILDEHNLDYRWASKEDWLKEPLHKFVKKIIEQ